MALAPRFIRRAVQSATVLAAGLALVGLAQAQTYYTATLNGAQETPSVPTPATGVGCFTLNAAQTTLSFNITFSGLIGTETAAHFHTGAVGVAGPLFFTLPPGNPKIGSAAFTPAQVASLLAGNVYANIHTTAFPGGEIRGQLVAVPPPTLFCFGDGTSGPCPCANTSPLGNDEGCLHSAGFGGRLRFTGAPSISCDSLQLCASQLLGTNCIFLQGPIAPIPPVFFGDGERCIGGSLKRLGLVGVNGGNACMGQGGTVPLSILGTITPGTYGYQVYFRDPNPFCTANTFNITNGVLATWVP